MKSTLLSEQAVMKDGTAPILFRITINETASSFSCKLSVDPAQWDAKNGQAVRNNVASKQVNRELKKIHKGIFKHYE